MSRQTTEMLKGLLEGIVLAVIAQAPTHGYDITAQLRDRGFTDLVEGTIYAVLLRIEQRGLVDVTKEPSEKGPPRKVYTLSRAGHDALTEFWDNWTHLAGRVTQLHTEGETP